MRLLPLAVALLATTAAVADTFQPPVPKGLRGETVIQPRRRIPVPPADRKWVRVRSRHFTIVSTATERAAREAATKLEVLTAALASVDARFAAQPDNAQVFLFRHGADSKPYIELLTNRSQSSTPGMFVANYDGTGTMIVDNSRPWADRTIFHELIHTLLATSGSRLPLWMEEGLAEFFSSAEVRGKFVVVGQPVIQHQRWLRGRGLVPLKELFAIERGSQTSTHPLFYAESWGVVDWLMRAGLGKFDVFIHDIETGRPVDEALQQIYGINSTVLERLLKRVPNRPAATMHIAVAADAGISAAPISRSEALHDLGDFLGRLEPLRPDAERHFAAAIEADPAYGRAYAGLGTLRTREKDFDAATPQFEKALQISPGDSEIYLEYGEALLRNAIGQFAGVIETDSGDVPRARKARELAERAIALGAERGRAQAVVGISYSVEKDVTPGIAALEEALVAHPLRLDVALTLYALNVRSGNRKNADELFERLFAKPRHPQITLAARSVYVREQLSNANNLIAAGRMDEAAAIVREVIDVTPDPAARLQLQGEVAKLEEDAETNGQIRAFNEAAALANRGQNDSALRIIEELLKKVSDTDLTRRVNALHKELQKRLGMQRSRAAL